MRLFEQSSDDADPLCVPRLLTHGLTRSTVPVSSNAVVGSFAVQVGMHQRVATDRIRAHAIPVMKVYAETLAPSIYLECNFVGRTALTVVPSEVDEMSIIPPNLRTRSFMPGIPTPYLGGALLAVLAVANPLP